MDLIQRERDLFARLLQLGKRQGAAPLLREALDIATAATRATHGYLAFYRTGSGDLARPDWFATAGLSEGDIEKVQGSISTGILHAAWTEAESVMTLCAWQDPRFDARKSVSDPRLQAVLATSLGSGPNAILYLYKDPGSTPGGGAAFTEADRRLVEQYRAHLSDAVDRLLLESPPGVTDPTAPSRAGGGFARIIGRSTALARVLDKAVVAAHSDRVVLITGLTGTGKTELARSIHEVGTRRSEPMMHIDCGALAPELFAADLFGTSGGPGMGTWQDKPGKIERAGAGTILLDEISRLSPTNQAALLRLVQERRFYRVNGDRELSTRARFICTTNDDLTELMRAGAFRSDLYHRVAQIVIDVPPLESRPEDIPLIADAAGRRVCEELGLPWRGLTPMAVAVCVSRPWPGHVRQLENVIGVAVESTRGAVPLDAGDLFPDASLSGVTPPEGLLPWLVERERHMAAHFRRAWLASCGDDGEVDPKKVSELLRIGRSTYFKLKARYIDGEGSEDDT